MTTTSDAAWGQNMRQPNAPMDPATPMRVTLREWSRYPALAGSLIEGIRLPDSPQVQALVQALDQQNKLRITEFRRGMSIETTSWVGRIRLGALEVTVQPKLQGLPLVRLLRYAYGLRHVDQESDADFAVSAWSFLDLLIHELAKEAENLIARGLRREYVKREANLSSPRGRIEVGQLARACGILTATLPCTFHERCEDAVLNQVLRAGLLLATGLTTDVRVKAKLRRIVAGLGDTVSPIRLGGQVFIRAERAVSRLTAAYEPVLTLIKLLWENQGLTLDDDAPRVELPGFLFDMNTFWQALLSRFLAEHLPDYRLEDEHRLRGVFAYDSAFNPRRQRAPTPRPDFALWHGHELAAILDAKYRDLWATSLPPEWLYQLSVYALSQPTARTATVLYPTVGRGAQEARVNIRDSVHGRSQAQVILRPVDVNELDLLLSAGIGASAVRGRQGLALRLAFGGV